VTLCSVAVGYQHFGGLCHLYLQAEDLNLKVLYYLYIKVCIMFRKDFVLFSLSNYLTNSMDESILRSYYSTSQEIPLLLWNLKVHFHVHKSLSLVSILNQMKLSYYCYKDRKLSIITVLPHHTRVFTSPKSACINLIL
jgi:hypothetical protein